CRRFEHERSRHHPMGQGRAQNFTQKRNAHSRGLPAACPRRPCAGPGNVSPRRRRRACPARTGEHPPSQTSDPTGPTANGLLTRRLPARCLSNVSPLVAVLKAAEGEIFTERGDPNHHTTSLIDNRAALPTLHATPSRKRRSLRELVRWSSKQIR